jgi:acyl dehydratase
LGGTSTRITDDDDSAYLDVYRHCRTMCLLAARAANVQAIDGVYWNVRDADGFRREAREVNRMGYDGKLTLHPHQIRDSNAAFVPSEEEMELAHRIVSMWKGDDDGGGGMDGSGDGRMRSMVCNGRMIDLPHYVRAKKVVAGGEAGSVRRRHVDWGVAVAAAATGDGATHSITIASTGDTGASASATTATVDGGAETITLFPRVNHGKYLEDLHPGMRIMHYLTRNVTESDNVFFTCLTLNPAPIHLDHEWLKENADELSSGVKLSNASSAAGRPLFNSMFTLALLVGMSVPECMHGTTVANLGFSEVSFPKPVYPGDTQRAETEVLDRRESRSRPNQGIVTFRHVAYNQRGEEVYRATRQALMKRRT